MDAISIHDITKTYGTKRAVSGLSLAVPQGSLFGLLGPNGAGKTTTIRMVLNIYAPDSGTIRVLGQPMSEGLKGRIGYLPEERGLYTRMQVGELLVFMAGMKGVGSAEAAKRARAWLARLELAGCWEKKLQDLSKGMQQKVQFVATVLHEPDLIILDEPFAGLDPINTNVLRDIMVELHAKGRTVVFSTHIMEQAERLCDGICIINEGRKALEGSLKEIKGRYGRNTVALGFEGDGDFLTSHPLVRRTSSYNAYVEVTLVDGADPQALLRDALTRVRVFRFEVVEPSLHDIFIERVQATAEPAAAVDSAGLEDVRVGAGAQH